MRSVLYYSPAVLSANGEDGPNATVDDIRATGAALSKSTKGACLLRDARFFDGNLEVVGDKYPDRVYLLGSGDDELLAKVRQAFESIEVEVKSISLHQEEASGADADPEEDDAAARLAALKAEATALGINFNAAIGEATLQKRVDAEKAKREKQDDA